ncbi:hypothetical protein [Gluconobacter cerinus]|uniref:hypothetical protein n=1 Tax=Gluconobacter cerinus TaxID=38307 RepID=UPI001B8BE375|nr:hypothetical protein [Gluconobacter cerinus]MBS1035553.1 hypothetical protein [Gluconobacter cerinus]
MIIYEKNLIEQYKRDNPFAENSSDDDVCGYIELTGYIEKKKSDEERRKRLENDKYYQLIQERRDYKKREYGIQEHGDLDYFLTGKRDPYKIEPIRIQKTQYTENGIEYSKSDWRSRKDIIG